MPAGSTYTPIATTTVGTATGTITFSSIPSIYTDLVLVGNAKFTNSTGEPTWVTFNSDSGTNYSRTTLAAYTNPPYSIRESNQTKIAIYSNSSTNFVPHIYNIMNYSNTTTYKTILFRTSSVGEVVTQAGLWRSTAAISTITLTMNTGANNFAVGTMWTLYGIASA